MPIEPTTKQNKDEPRPRSENSDNLVQELYFGTAEKTFQESSWVSKSLYKPFNSDDLYQKTGDYTLYEDMLNDDQISIAMRLKLDLMLGSGWTIVTEDEDQNEIADSLYVDLEEYPDVALEDMIEDMLYNSYSFGFSLSEKIFNVKADGGLCLKNIKTRYPNSWLIHTDRKGNIERYEQHSVEGSIDVDPKSLIHLTTNQRHQNPYGTSDLRAAYEAWFVKRHLVRFYSIFLEKNASPIPIARYASGLDNAKVTEVFNIIKNFQTKSAMAVPKDFEVEFLEAKGDGSVYEKGINLFNMFIGRALVIPDLLGYQGAATGGGSYSLGKDQMAVFFKHINRRKRSIERAINRHIVNPLVVWNYGYVEGYPKFQLNPVSDENALEYAKTYLELAKGKLYKPTLEEINHVKDLIKFPTSDDIEIYGGGAGQAGGYPTGMQEQNPKPGEDVDDEEKPTEAKFIDLGHFKAKPENGEYYKRVDFKAVQSVLDSDEKTILAKAQPIVKDIIVDVLDQVEKKNILGSNPKIERIESLKLKYLKKLQLVFKHHFKQAYLSQKSLAAKELFKQEFSQPIPSERFLDFLETETFQYVGDYEYGILKKIRLKLIEAAKDGKPLSEIEGILSNELEELSDVSIERYARTKLTEVMNRARVDEFEKSEIVAAYQYSAILDGRTTEICEALDGKIFEKGTEPIPPLHFNCRSLLVPITRFEDYKVDKKIGSKDIQSYIDENKGEGFAKK